MKVFEKKISFGLHWKRPCYNTYIILPFVTVKDFSPGSALSSKTGGVKASRIEAKKCLGRVITLELGRGARKLTGREPKSCLGQVFNFKLYTFGVVNNVHCAHACTYLKLKTRPRFCPWLGPFCFTAAQVHSTFEATPRVENSAQVSFC